MPETESTLIKDSTITVVISRRVIKGQEGQFEQLSA